MTTGQFWIGLDVGGTNVDAIIVDAALTVHATSSNPVDKSDLVGQFARIINELRGDKQIAAIGIGFPGQIDTEAGVVLLAVHLIEEPLHLRAELSSRFNVPIFIENDANAFVLGAQQFLNPDNYKNVAFITLGTAVGMGLVLDGRLFRGSHGLSGEISHIVVAPESSERCACGNYGCLALFVGASTFARMGNQHATELAELDEFSAESIAHAAHNGNPAAQAIYNEIGRRLGMALQMVVMLFDVEKVYIGGGIAQAGSILMQPILAEWERQRNLSALAATQLQESLLHLVTPEYKAGIWGAIALIQVGLNNPKLEHSTI